MDDNPELLPASIDRQVVPSNEVLTEERESISPGRSLGYAALGLLYRSAQRANRRAARVTSSIDRLSRLAVAPLQPITDSSLFQPIRKQVDSLAARGQQELDRLIQDGQTGAKRSRQVSQQALNSVVGEVIGDISDNPNIQVLIQQQVEILAAETPTIPELDELVRKLADNYINYLNDHPEQVQNLLARQSVTLSTQIREELNERLVTADSLLEMLVRRLFRRTPRQELPGPPPDVKARATKAILDSDFPRMSAGRNVPY